MMFQNFDASTTSESVSARISDLRNILLSKKIDGFLVPLSDEHQGEYVTPRDQRLAWLTSFTGSAGYSAVLQERAALFVDGRYTIQAPGQTNTNIFEIKNHPNEPLAVWLNEALSKGKIAYDPWLHTKAEIDNLQAKVNDEIELVSSENLIDLIWKDRPSAPKGSAYAHPLKYSGLESDEKRKLIAQAIRNQNATAAVLTLPDSICWLLNIRGSDLDRVPVIQCFAIIDLEGNVHLFVDLQKVGALKFDSTISLHTREEFESILANQNGSVIVDKRTAPLAVTSILRSADVEIKYATDPCILPKAIKNKIEINGAIDAHVRDGMAVVQFLKWLDENGHSGVSEIDLVKHLEACRRATGKLQNISFDTISGSGPNGAIVHYRVTNETNRQLKIGDVMLVDSGGQYLDGTTDITRTVAIGPASPDAKRAFTLVLKGMIAVSTARFPKGLSGRDIDPLARRALWEHGMDFDHGTGHGVGSYLSVHEGPQGISKRSEVPLEAGMILSNEPGYYKAGDYGIRIENLIYIKPADPIAGGDDREMFEFETLTFAPIDLAMIDVTLLSEKERVWLNSYHAQVFEKLNLLLDNPTKEWLSNATRAI